MTAVGLECFHRFEADRTCFEVSPSGKHVARIPNILRFSSWGHSLRSGRSFLFERATDMQRVFLGLWIQSQKTCKIVVFLVINENFQTIQIWDMCNHTFNNGAHLEASVYVYWLAHIWNDSEKTPRFPLFGMILRSCPMPLPHSRVQPQSHHDIHLG